MELALQVVTAFDSLATDGNGANGRGAALLAAAAALGADGAASAARTAYRIYADRLIAAAILTDPAR